jgi:class 3 adenylate cyclase
VALRNGKATTNGEQSYIHRFIPREFLDKLERESLADVKLGDHVEHEMTVFFSDIRDFTFLSESLTPQQNFSFLTSYLRNVTPIIRKNGGFVDKYLGDGVMALFPGDAADAVRASVGCCSNSNATTSAGALPATSRSRSGWGCIAAH